MTTLRWGILGPGRIAPRLVRGVAASPRGELVAVASRDLARASAFAATHGIARAYGSYAELLDDPEVDVVYIALPNHLHAPWAVRALDAGKHVLCEKPLALTAEDVDAIIAASERSGRAAAEAFMYLHHPQIVRSVALAQRWRPRDPPGRPRVVLVLPRPPGRPASGAVHGRRVDLGRRLLPGQPGPPRRRRGARQARRVRPLRRAGRRPHVRRAAALPRAACSRSSTAGSRRRTASGSRSSGSDATLVLDAPFLCAPDGPPPTVTMWRDGEGDAGGRAVGGPVRPGGRAI